VRDEIPNKHTKEAGMLKDEIEQVLIEVACNADIDCPGEGLTIKQGVDAILKAIDEAIGDMYKEKYPQPKIDNPELLYFLKELRTKLGLEKGQ